MQKKLDFNFIYLCEYILQMPTPSSIIYKAQGDAFKT